MKHQARFWWSNFPVDKILEQDRSEKSSSQETPLKFTDVKPILREVFLGELLELLLQPIKFQQPNVYIQTDPPCTRNIQRNLEIFSTENSFNLSVLILSSTNLFDVLLAAVKKTMKFLVSFVIIGLILKGDLNGCFEIIYCKRFNTVVVWHTLNS